MVCNHSLQICVAGKRDLANAYRDSYGMGLGVHHRIGRHEMSAAKDAVKRRTWSLEERQRICRLLFVAQRHWRVARL